jgi:hypothetical protein
VTRVESALLRLLAVITFAPLLANAQQSFVARCSEPVGNRYDKVDGQVQQQADGFKNVNPVFFFSADSPDKLTFVWGSAAWARDALKLRDNLQVATTIYRSDDMISALLVDPKGASQIYSLFPRRGLVYFTQHRHIAPQMGGVPSAATFYAECDFSK